MDANNTLTVVLLWFLTSCTAAVPTYSGPASLRLVPSNYYSRMPRVTTQERQQPNTAVRPTNRPPPANDAERDQQIEEAFANIEREIKASRDRMLKK